MGRPKKELKMILTKKRRRAQEKVKQCAKGDVTYSDLSQLAKKLLKKKAKHKPKTA